MGQPTLLLHIQFQNDIESLQRWEVPGLTIQKNPWLHQIRP